MRVLVTGSEGNIGSKLVPYLKSLNHDVFCVDIKQSFREGYTISDITNPIDLVKVVNDFKPEIVVHMAAMVSRVTCEKSPTNCVDTNLSGLNNIIELCKLNDSKLIYFSTSEIYGNISGELTEDRLDIEPNNLYGLTKYLGEKLVEHNVKHHNLKAITVRPFMFYDEDETFGENRSAMIRFAENLLKNEKIQVHKNSCRSWLHISDAVVLIEKTFYLEDYNAINIANTEVVDMEVFSRKMCDLLGKNFNDLCDVIEQPKQMTLEKRPSTKKMIELLGYNPNVDLDCGLKLVLNKVEERLKK